MNDPTRWFELDGAKIAIRSLTLLSDVFKHSILVPLNHAMHVKSKMVRDLGSSNTTGFVFQSIFMHCHTPIFVPELTLVSLHRKNKSKIDSMPFTSPYIGEDALHWVM